MKLQDGAFGSPHDTLVSGALRFLVEIIAWVAGPWAVAQISLWLVVPVLVILVGMPAVFSTVGDKRKVIVPTPGPVRVLIELLLYVVAVGGAWIAWPIVPAIVSTVIVIAALATGIPRTMWLLRGALLDDDR